MRALAIALLLLTACARPPQPIVDVSPTPEPGVLVVTALLDLSGDRAPRGDAQRNALQLWTDLDQARGGARVRVRLRIVDVASSDARLLIELRRAAVDDRADTVIIGVPATFATPGFSAAAGAAGVPLLFTLPLAEPVAQQGGRWSFALAPTPEQLARRVADIPATESLIDTFVVVPDGKARDGETSAILLEYARRLTQPAVLTLDRSKGDQLQMAARITAGARRVHVAGPPRDWGVLGQALKQNARPLATRYVLSYLTEHTDLGEFRDGLDAVWPAPLHLTLSAIPPGAAASARRQFVQSYTDRHGPPTAHAAAAFDALTLLALAAERSGADDRERLREQLESTTFAGIATTYAFSMTRHAGHSGEDLALYRWSGSAPVLVIRR